MKKITIALEFDIKIPEDMEDFSDSVIIDSVNGLYDVYGKDMPMYTISEFTCASLLRIDNVDVHINGNPIILDGERLSEDAQVYKGYEYNLGNGSDHG